MFKKKQVLTLIGIAIISFLIGTTLSNATLAIDVGGNPFDKIWGAITELQARVTAIEEYDKAWHFKTSFTLSSDERVSQLFFIQGEKWRFKWEPEEGTQGYAFILLVFDEHDNAIEYFDSFSFVHQEPPIVEGVHYMSHGKGNYYLYVSYFGYPEQRESFTIESYH